MRRAGAATLAALSLGLGACGEKEENLSSGTTATEATTTVAATIKPQVAEQRARGAASAAVPNEFTVKPGAWNVSCTGGESGVERPAGDVRHPPRRTGGGP